MTAPEYHTTEGQEAYERYWEKIGFAQHVFSRRMEESIDQCGDFDQVVQNFILRLVDAGVHPDVILYCLDAELD